MPNSDENYILIQSWDGTRGGWFDYDEATSHEEAKEIVAMLIRQDTEERGYSERYRVSHFVAYELTR